MQASVMSSLRLICRLQTLFLNERRWDAAPIPPPPPPPHRLLLRSWLWPLTSQWSAPAGIGGVWRRYHDCKQMWPVGLCILSSDNLHVVSKQAACLILHIWWTSVLNKHAYGMHNIQKRAATMNYSQQIETTTRKFDLRAFLFWFSSPLYLSFSSLMLSPALRLSLSISLLSLPLSFCPLSICGVPAKFSMIFPFERDKERDEREGRMEGDLGSEGGRSGTLRRMWWRGRERRRGCRREEGEANKPREVVKFKEIIKWEREREMKRLVQCISHYRDVQRGGRLTSLNTIRLSLSLSFSLGFFLTPTCIFIILHIAAWIEMTKVRISRMYHN